MLTTILNKQVSPEICRRNAISRRIKASEPVQRLLAELVYGERADVFGSWAFSQNIGRTASLIEGTR